MAAPRAAREHLRAPAEYHLPKVFSKLGISSRRRLRHYLALRNPDGAPPEAIAGGGEFRLRTPRRGLRQMRAPLSGRDATWVTHPERAPARTIASNPMRDSQMVGPQRKPRR